MGTVLGAAQVLHLTQPAVSQHVAARDSALRNPLFQRTPRRMVPTEAGQRLYTQIAGAMRNSNQFPTKTQPPKLHKPSESVRPIIFYRSTSRSITTGRSQFYTVQFGLTAELIQQLKAGKLDIVIATKKITLSDIEYELLF